MSASRLPKHHRRLGQVALKQIEEIVKIEKEQDEYHFLHKVDGAAVLID